MNRPPELQDLFDAIARGGPYASIDEVNRILSARLAGYNTTPQAELGGLSPDELSQLVYGDWRSDGALRLNESLEINALAGVPFFSDARVLMEYLHEQGPVKETPARNLPRAIVAALLPRLSLSDRWPQAVEMERTAPINEGDVPWLSELRHTLLFGGLVKRRKGLGLSARGRQLLNGECAGELYAELFRTLFRQLDLRVLDRNDRHAGMQSTIVYSFYQLSNTARDWSTSQALANSAWLESAKDPPSDWERANIDLRHYSFAHRVLNPLVRFGLLERRELPGEQPWQHQVEYRCSALFDEFLRFEFRP